MVLAPTRGVGALDIGGSGRLLSVIGRRSWDLELATWDPKAHNCGMGSMIRAGSSAAAISQAVARLRAGGLVAIPTETVYGLGADARSATAVGRIFQVKGRPRDHPLIVHVSADEDLARWSIGVPDYAVELAHRFWPGPLTLVLQRSSAVLDEVTGGQPTVAIRAPDHPVAQELLAQFGGGIAAPSANVFGAVSPTTAQHVLADIGSILNPQTDMILDGGRCSVGLESTIVDCTRSRPRLLRLGQIGSDELAEVRSVADSEPKMSASKPVDQIRAPGSLESHYAPRAKVQVLEASELPALSAQRTIQDLRVGLIALADTQTPSGWTRLLEPTDTRQYAHDLYQGLRAADELGIELLVAVRPVAAGSGGEQALARAICDRLTRAAA
jgi:L-threonylcarbamoyladenylate synthase